MKRVVSAGTRPAPPTKRPSRANIHKVCDSMGWKYPRFIDLRSNGFRCRWSGVSFVAPYIWDEAMKPLCDEYDIDYSILKDNGRLDDKYWGAVDILADRANLDKFEFITTDEGRQFQARYVELRRDSQVVDAAYEDADKELDVVYDRSGVSCFLNQYGFLMIPFADE